MIIEYLAEELHKTYRAAFKALHSGRGSFMGVGRRETQHGTKCMNEHDHGWVGCPRKKYFRRRAEAIIKGEQILIAAKVQGLRTPAEDY